MSMSEEPYIQIQRLAKQMRGLEITELEAKLHELRQSPGNDRAGPLVLALAITRQVLPIREAYVMPTPLTAQPCCERWGNWHLAVFCERAPDEIDLLDLRNRLFDYAPRSVGNKIEILSYTDDAEQLAQAMATGIHIPLYGQSK